MGHFDFQLMSAGGVPLDTPIRVKTATGVMLNCPDGMDTEQVYHLCDIARQTEDYPVDLCLWNDDKSAILWAARIHWREQNGCKSLEDKSS